MKRQVLVGEIVALLETSPTVEMDCFDFSQSWWVEAGPFWDSYYNKDYSSCKTILQQGSWGDAALHNLKRQLIKWNALV